MNWMWNHNKPSFPYQSNLFSLQESSSKPKEKYVDWTLGNCYEIDEMTKACGTSKPSPLDLGKTLVGQSAGRLQALKSFRVVWKMISSTFSQKYLFYFKGKKPFLSVTLLLQFLKGSSTFVWFKPVIMWKPFLINKQIFFDWINKNIENKLGWIKCCNYFNHDFVNLN